jgi:hypothetical protein
MPRGNGMPEAQAAAPQPAKELATARRGRRREHHLDRFRHEDTAARQRDFRPGGVERGHRPAEGGHLSADQEA